MSDQYLFGPHKISDLLSRNEGLAPHVFGVDVDTFDPQPLAGVRSIGFLAKVDEGQFDFDLMDTMIQYHQIHCQIFIEVPFDFPMSARDVLVIAGSVSCNVIVRPPEEKTTENWLKWKDYTQEFLSALLELPAHSQEVLPVTSYIQYMSMNVMGHQPATLTDNPLMHEYFEKGMDTTTMDDLKSHLSQAILDYYGGAQEFEVMVHSTLSAMHDNLKSMGEKALARIQQALDNGNGEQICDALMEMLKRKSFPSEDEARAIVEAALADTSGLLIGLESQLDLQSQAGAEDDAILALASLITDLRQLSTYRQA